MSDDLKTRGRWLQFSLRTLFLGMTLCSVLLSVWLYWDYFPGTVRVDRQGFVHGTGTLKHFYTNGSLRQEVDYRNGIIDQSRWYHTDGSRLATDDFYVNCGGTGHYFREDGTLQAEIHFQFSPEGHDYHADGTAVYYNPDGTIEHTAVYKDGSEVHPSQSGP